MPRRKSAPKSEAQRAKNRRQNDIQLNRRIFVLQNVDIPLISKLPFSRLVREIMQQYQENYRISAEALTAVQEACEFYLTFLLGDAYLLTLHRKRVTLNPADVRMVIHIRDGAHR